MSRPVCQHFESQAGLVHCTQSGRKAPRDCPDCPSYQPDVEQLPEAERTRCEVWAQIHSRVEADRVRAL